MQEQANEASKLQQQLQESQQLVQYLKEESQAQTGLHANELKDLKARLEEVEAKYCTKK